MTTTHTHPSAHQRHHSRQQHSNYAVVWGLIVAATVAAVVYGYYTTERAVSAQEMNATQAYAPVSPTADGTTSSLMGKISSDVLTPSTTAPGTPDTTTTESSAVPTQGMR